MIIDFTALDADILPDADGNPTENRRTVMDYSIAAGASFTNQQKVLMKTSLTLPNWEVELNSSAKTAIAVANSSVVNAPVKDSATVLIRPEIAGKNVMGIRVFFPNAPFNANARIKPPYEIPAYEPLRTRDDNGDVQQQTAEEKATGRTLFEADTPDDPKSSGFGIVKNVGTIKALKVTVFGDQYPHGLYVILKDTDNVEHRYFMGYLKFDGWKELKWTNEHYLTDVRAREIRVYPVYPRGVPFVKFMGFQITRNAEQYNASQAFAEEFISYIADVSIIYDKAVLTTDRDIDEEDLWGIVTKKETSKQNAEIQRFGNKQVDRFIEKEKMATEDEFASTIFASQN
jgi:hypothetical protein